MTREQVKALCVGPGCSIRRHNIWIAFWAFLHELKKFRVPCEVWIDGSFVTEENEPDDVDFSVMIDSDAYENLSSEAKAFLLEISLLTGKMNHYLDPFVCIVYPRGSEERDADPPEAYARQWGVGHDERHLKGFIVLEVPHDLI